MPFTIGPPKNFRAEMGSYLLDKLTREWEEEWKERQRKKQAEPEEMSPFEGALEGAKTGASMGGSFGGLWGMIGGATSGAVIGYAGAEHGGAFADATPWDESGEDAAKGAARTQAAMQISGTIGQAWTDHKRKKEFDQFVSTLPEDQQELLRATRHDPSLYGRAFGAILQQQAAENRVAAQLDKELITKYGVTFDDVQRSADRKGVSLRDELSYLSTTKASSEQQAKNIVEQQKFAEDQYIKAGLASGDLVSDVSEFGQKENLVIGKEIDKTWADPDLDWQTKQKLVAELSQQKIPPRIRLRDKQTEKTLQEKWNEQALERPDGSVVALDRSGNFRKISDAPETVVQQYDETFRDNFKALRKGDDDYTSADELSKIAREDTNAMFGLPPGMGASGRTVLIEEDMRRRQGGQRGRPQMAPSAGAGGPGATGIGGIGSFIDNWKRGGAGAQAPVAAPAAPLPPDMIPEHKPRSVVPRLVSTAAEHLRSLSIEVNDADPKTWTEYQVNKAMPAVMRRLKELADRKASGRAPFTKADVKELAWLQSIKNRAPYWNRR